MTEVNGGRCDRCRYWEPAPIGADTMRGICRRLNVIGPLPIWVPRCVRMSADQGHACKTFSAGTWSSDGWGTTGE